MAIIKMKCKPEDRKAIIGVSLTAHPTSVSVSLETKEPILQLVVGLRVIESTQPEKAITVCRSGTILAHEDGVDILAQGALGAGLISTSDESRIISLGRLKVHNARSEKDDSPNLMDRDLEFVTVPADGTEVTITHDLSDNRLFEHSEIKRGEIRPGETFKMHMDSKYVGTMWWCWGDVNGDLKGKKLHAWQKGINLGDATKPSQEEIGKEGWVLGEDPSELEFQDKSGWTETQFVA